MTGTLITIVFILAYFAIAFENNLKVNKAGVALLAGTLCWTLLAVLSGNSEVFSTMLTSRMGGISGILFFLLSAMTIVELMDSHNGFSVITERITTRDSKKLLVIVSLLAFFLSALLDNLTTTIVMISLTRKLIRAGKDRWIFAGMIIIAANAGGAWSPMGDVTTTMLWIGKQISGLVIIYKLFLPGLACVLVPLFIAVRMIGKDAGLTEKHVDSPVQKEGPAAERRLVFVTGILCLISVPLFNILTGLPPFLGMILSLGLMWVITELLHRKKHEHERKNLSVAQALKRLDTPTILFFLGILLCISALEAAGMLEKTAGWLSSHFRSQSVVVLIIGLCSAVVDNVPLVAAVQGMYPLAQFPTDHFLWEFLAYATGTGGSILIIGSAAGVAAMGMEKITFFWYLKRIAPLAILGYLTGALVYIGMLGLF